MNPHHWWYTDVKRAIMHLPKYKDKTEPEYVRYKEAISEALKDVENNKNAAERLQAIDEILFKQTKTIDGVAMDMNYSRNTVQYWINDFINSVGFYKGYENKRKAFESRENNGKP